jgi:hypothetical protein
MNLLTTSLNAAAQVLIALHIPVHQRERVPKVQKDVTRQKIIFYLLMWSNNVTA